MRKLSWSSPSKLPDAWVLPINSYGINRAFMGGLESGRFHCFTGPKASGKSTQALYAIAAAQRMGKVCAYVDAEKTFDAKYAAKCGVDIDSLKYLREGANVAEGICDLIVPELDKHLVDLIVIDSLSTINLESFYTDPTANPMGISARSAGFVLDKLLNSLHRDQMIILISHVSMQKSGMHFVMAAKSSNKQDHIVSNTIFFRAGNGDSNLRDDGFRKVTWKLAKTKQPVVADSGEYYFKGATAQIDTLDELVDVAKELDIVTGGAWLNYIDDNGEIIKFHGKPQLISELQEHPDLRSSIELRIKQHDASITARTVDGLEELEGEVTA